MTKKGGDFTLLFPGMDTGRKIHPPSPTFLLTIFYRVGGLGLSILFIKIPAPNLVHAPSYQVYFKKPTTAHRHKTSLLLLRLLLLTLPLFRLTLNALQEFYVPEQNNHKVPTVVSTRPLTGAEPFLILNRLARTNSEFCPTLARTLGF